MTEKDLRLRINIVIFLLFALTPILFLADISPKIDKADEFKRIYLLNSGLVDCEEATVKYILWTEENVENLWIEQQMPLAGLQWQKEVLINYYGGKAFKYTALTLVNRETEEDITHFMNTINQRIEGRGINLYMEQKVDSYLDPAAFFGIIGAEPIERVETEGEISLSGLYSDWTENQAERRQMNIQIITRDQEWKETPKTVLAVPVLLEEF